MVIWVNQSFAQRPKMKVKNNLARSNGMETGGIGTGSGFSSRVSQTPSSPNHKTC